MTPKGALEFLFNPNGRITRRGLALGMLLPFVVVIGLADASNSWVLAAAAWAFFSWPLLIATPFKRLHDTGRMGKWNLIFLVFYAMGFGFFLMEYVPAEGGWAALFDGEPPTATDDDLSANGVGGFSTVLIFLPIQFFWLYLIPSQPGDNRYGPAPRARQE